MTLSMRRRAMKRRFRRSVSTVAGALMLAGYYMKAGKGQASATMKIAMHADCLPGYLGALRTRYL